MNNHLPAIVESIQPPADIPASIPGEDWTIVREWLRSKRSPHTRRSYTRNIGMFFTTLALPLRQITLTHLQDYRDMLAVQHPETSTQAQIIASIKSLFTFAHRTGYLQMNIGAAVQLPQPKDKLAERILTDIDLYKILAQSEKSSTRNHMLVLLLYGSACRPIEICNLRWRDCHTNGETGQITAYGKRSKTRSIVLHPTIWRSLMQYKPEDASPDDYVFPSRQTDDGGRRLSEARIWQIVSEIATAAGLKDISPYFLRHTHASKALRGNEKGKASLKLLQETLGHTSLATTGRYLHVMPEESSSLYLDF